MKKGCLKKAFGVILCFAMIFAFSSFPVSARYQYIAVLNAGLSINSSGFATCSGLVKPSDNDTSTTLTVELQKYSSGWKYDDSWNTSGLKIAQLRYMVWYLTQQAIMCNSVNQNRTVS